jgi:hypothetical protein
MPRARFGPIAGGLLGGALLLGGLCVFAAPSSAEPLPPPPPGQPPTYRATPFGPGYDPLRPPPEVPVVRGPGLEKASLVVSGHADVEELRSSEEIDGTSLFGVVVDLRVAPGSTTAVLDAASVTLKQDGAGDLPLFAICFPSAEPPLSLFRELEVRFASWNVGIGGRILVCSGRNARLASRVDVDGVMLTTPEGQAWEGPAVLLFRSPPAGASRLSIASLVVPVPAPDKAGEAAGSAETSQPAKAPEPQAASSAAPTPGGR